MHASITIEFDYEDQDTLDSVCAIWAHTLPYMVDNIRIVDNDEDIRYTV